MVSINVVGIRLYFVAYNIHILSTDLLSANLRFFLKTATNLLLYMRTLKRYSDLCVLFLFSATPIKFQQANYLTFGGLLSRNAGDFFWVGQCRGRFLRVFERLASI